MTKTVNLQEFHRMMGPELEDAEALPRGPSKCSGGNEPVKTRKWIAEWGGRSELEDAPPGDAPPAAPAISVEAFKAALDLALKEFLIGFDLVEALRAIVELRSPDHHMHIVKRGVLRALDGTERECELIAVLFASLHVRGVLTSEQIGAGFRSLIEHIDDISIDCPMATPQVAHFLSDAVLDGLLDASAIAEWPRNSVVAEAEARMAGRQPLLSVLDCPSGRKPAPASLRRELRSIVDEYLSACDVAEVRRRLAELRLGHEHQHELVKLSIEMSLDRKEHERELISKLLSELIHDPIRPAAVSAAFETLLERVEDLAIDNLQAPTMLAAFLVRAISDDVLPPAFVKQEPPQLLSSDLLKDTLTRACAQLAAAHFSERRRNVWGKTADGSLADLKAAIAELVGEFLVSGEEAEAVRCLRELGAPAFHHELIKRLLAMATDKGEHEQRLAHTLRQRLCRESLVSPEQLALGCQRALEASADLSLDNPKAPEIVAAFIEACVVDGDLEGGQGWLEAAKGLREHRSTCEA